MTSHFGERLRDTMRILNRTQVDLADELGVSQTAVSKWIRGATQPRMDQFVRTAEALKVPLDYLAADDEDVAEEAIMLRRQIARMIREMGLVEAHRRLSGR